MCACVRVCVLRRFICIGMKAREECVCGFVCAVCTLVKTGGISSHFSLVEPGGRKRCDEGDHGKDVHTCRREIGY